VTERQHVNIGKQHPTSYKALVALSTAAEESAAVAGLDPFLVEPVKIRTSQMPEGCVPLAGKRPGQRVDDLVSAAHPAGFEPATVGLEVERRSSTGWLTDLLYLT
jgi:hypothetical protein